MEFWRTTGKFEGVVRLYPCRTAIDGISPFFGSLPVDENPNLCVPGGPDRRVVEIPLIETEHAGMEYLHDLLNVLRIERFWHQRPLGAKLLDLTHEIGMLGPKQHVTSHVVPFDGGDQILRRSIFGVDVDADPAVRSGKCFVEGWHTQIRKLPGETDSKIKRLIFANVLSLTNPLPSVIRSTVRSCISTSLPSAVVRMPNSTKSMPASMAASIAGIEFSG